MPGPRDRGRSGSILIGANDLAAAAGGELLVDAQPGPWPDGQAVGAERGYVGLAGVVSAAMPFICGGKIAHESIEFLMNLTEPSQKPTFTPPGWKLMALYGPQFPRA